MGKTPLGKKQFQKMVYEYFRKNGRDFPWRKTTNPYRILVSEIMLQQTQTDRVVEKYREFLKRFPNPGALADASLSEVLRVWQGLGYNRRAKNLHACAKEIVLRHGGCIPKSYDKLLALPGVGPYTAGAVLAFAYNEAVSMIETNIRTVYLHHFFKNKKDVSDTDILACVEETLDRENPRVWYAALMDYGAHLKRTEGNQNMRSKHYTKQTPFKGSNRYVRGKVLKLLGECSRTEAKLLKEVSVEKRVLKKQLQALYEEKFVEKKGRVWKLLN